MGMRAVLVTALAAALVAALAGRARACGKAMLNAGLGRESAPSPPLGTPTDISVDNANVVKAANFAIAKYNMKSNDVYLYRSQRLVSAKQQSIEKLKEPLLDCTLDSGVGLDVSACEVTNEPLAMSARNVLYKL